MGNSILGMIYLFSAGFAPEGFALCNGQTLPIAQYQALFSVVGTTYGGDGKTNFALPKLSAPEPGSAYLIAINGIYPSRG